MASVTRRNLTIRGQPVTRYQVRWRLPGGERTSRIVSNLPGAERLKARVERAVLLTSPRVSEADIGGNLIVGREAIAAWMGISFEALRHLQYSKGLPVFRIAGDICALKTELTAYRQESEHVPAAEAA